VANTAVFATSSATKPTFIAARSSSASRPFTKRTPLPRHARR
jgi:hypothetical protein